MILSGALDSQALYLEAEGERPGSKGDLGPRGPAGAHRSALAAERQGSGIGGGGCSNPMRSALADQTNPLYPLRLWSFRSDLCLLGDMWRSDPPTAPNNPTRANDALVCPWAALSPPRHRGVILNHPGISGTQTLFPSESKFLAGPPVGTFPSKSGPTLHHSSPYRKSPLAVWATRLRGLLAALGGSKHTGRAPPHAPPIITSRLSRQGAGLPPWSFPLARATGHLGCPGGDGRGGWASGFPAPDA